ncbi:hypothetical protein SLE2022_247290 [Rubroshorea leprosula]
MHYVRNPIKFLNRFGIGFCRFLDKAAVKTGAISPWMLCPVTQVEQTKQMVKMVPILVASFMPITMISEAATLFVKQGTTLHRNMGPKFDIASSSLSYCICDNLHADQHCCVQPLLCSSHQKVHWKTQGNHIASENGSWPCAACHNHANCLHG